MPVTDPVEGTWSLEAQRRHLRWNFAAMSLDGGFYMAGAAFVAAETVLPSLLNDLGGPTWLVALAPSLGVLGFVWSPLFTAHRVERLTRYRDVVAVTSIAQRLPPLLAGLALLYLAGTHPVLTLAVVAAGPFVMGLVGGLTLTAFWELFSKVLPEGRRAANLATRHLIGMGLGLAVAPVVAFVLKQWPGTAGYGVLHLCWFGGLLLSLVAFWSIRELPHVRAPRPVRGLRENLRGLVPLWREDGVLRALVTARVAGMGLTVLTPFLAIHAREVLGRGEDLLGALLAAQLTGAVFANMIVLARGDRLGGRRLCLLSNSLVTVLAASTLVVRFEWGFLAIFFLLGFVNFLGLSGTSTLQLELFPADRRPTCLALVSVALVPALLGAAALSAVLRDLSGGVWPAALLVVVTSLVAVRLFGRLPVRGAAHAGG